MPLKLLGNSAADARRLLRKIEAEQRFLQTHEKNSEEIRAAQAARLYDHQLVDEKLDDISFSEWSLNRAHDILDFDYLFFHRGHLIPTCSNHLEVISAKINYVTRDGEDGYFKKLEKNVGWTRHITPIVMACVACADKLVMCGIWSHAKNSRRCHYPDLCPCCLWNDLLKLLITAYGTQSGAFGKAEAWWFITCGFTTNPNNAKFVSRGLEPDDLDYVLVDRGYDPYPTQLGRGINNEATDPDFDYDDVRVLGLIIQDAMDSLYQGQLVDGYRNKLEGAFGIFPGRPNRVNLHGHAIANGSETNGQFLAEQLFEAMANGLLKYKDHLGRNYFPDVTVLRIKSAQDLQRCIRYSEKVVPVDVIVAEAMARPEAKLANGLWDETYACNLETSLMRLLGDDLPNIFIGFRLDKHLHNLRRRKTVGNMTFNDKGTCIGNEPRWHINLRHKRAKKLREYRARLKREKQLRLGDTATDVRTKVARKATRRFRRSMKRRSVESGIVHVNEKVSPETSESNDSS